MNEEVCFLAQSILLNLYTFTLLLIAINLCLWIFIKQIKIARKLLNKPKEDK